MGVDGRCGKTRPRRGAETRLANRALLSRINHFQGQVSISVAVHKGVRIPAALAQAALVPLVLNAKLREQGTIRVAPMTGRISPPRKGERSSSMDDSGLDHRFDSGKGYKTKQSELDDVERYVAGCMLLRHVARGEREQAKKSARTTRGW